MISGVKLAVFVVTIVDEMKLLPIMNATLIGLVCILNTEKGRMIFLSSFVCCLSAYL
jgi:hypothetical protein